MKKAKILVAYHKAAFLLRSSVLQPIQVGRRGSAAGPLEGMIGDDTGENISSKNSSYCELTALYWAWKNLDALGNPDYIGLFHYRRVLNLFEPSWVAFRVNQIVAKVFKHHYLYGLLVSETTVRRTCSGYDLVLPEPGRFYFKDGKEMSLFEQYIDHGHFPEDMMRAVEIIRSKSPRLGKLADEVLFRSNKFYAGNIFVMRTDLFVKSMEWLFGVLFEVEKFIDPVSSKYNAYQARVFGFLGERLLNVYFQYLRDEDPSLRITERPLVWPR